VAEERRMSGRLQLGLIAAVFFGPLLFAAWLYFQGNLIQPAGRTNNGALLEPIINLGEELPDSALRTHNRDHWLLLYMNSDACESECREALYASRQSRLMLGKEMVRVNRVFLHGDTPPDTVFLENSHKGLITLSDSKLEQLLANKKPAGLPAGGYYLIDPIGNLVMYFRPDINPRDMVEDIKHLLTLSRIG
jgi:hypothetical protein